MKHTIVTLILIFCCVSLEAKTQQTPRKHHSFPWGVVIRGALNFTAASMDVQGTQQCLNEKPLPGCIEGNPAMPTNPRIVWPLTMTITSADTFLDFEAWKHHRKWGWIAPVEDITVHTVGAVTGWTK